MNHKGALFIKSQVYNTSFDFQVEGTSERPRLCVFRSNKHIYVQVIDDSKMHTLASASTMQKPISEEFDYSAGPTAVSSQICFLKKVKRPFLLGVMFSKVYMNEWGGARDEIMERSPELAEFDLSS